jgi:transcriptional regulator of acetoin/glycerol metabolism
LAEQERNAILEALHACGGNVSEAARRLGVSRGKVYRTLSS